MFRIAEFAKQVRNHHCSEIGFQTPVASNVTWAQPGQPRQQEQQLDVVVSKVLPSRTHLAGRRQMYERHYGALLNI
jgi:hypothetical protein